MGFSSEWNAAYTAQQQSSVWPWSDLVSYVMRYAKPKSTKESVLELGCGAGANIPFFVGFGINYYGIDGSVAIIKALHYRYPNLKKHIFAGDFTKNIPGLNKFNLVIDRGSLTHNDAASIKNCLKLIRNRMSSGSKYIGIDWFSTNHSDYTKGKSAGDEYTRADIKTGQFVGLGNVHFSNRKHLEALFDGFEIIQLEEKIVHRTIPKDNHVFSSWNFCAVRK